MAVTRPRVAVALGSLDEQHLAPLGAVAQHRRHRSRSVLRARVRSAAAEPILDARQLEGRHAAIPFVPWSPRDARKPPPLPRPPPGALPRPPPGDRLLQELRAGWRAAARFARRRRRRILDRCGRRTASRRTAG